MSDKPEPTQAAMRLARQLITMIPPDIAGTAREIEQVLRLPELIALLERLDLSGDATWDDLALVREFVAYLKGTPCQTES